MGRGDVCCHDLDLVTLGLEELAQQSKINYSVVANSPYFEYFKNMAGAEEELYKVWKDLTLSSNADQSRHVSSTAPVGKESKMSIVISGIAFGITRSRNSTPTSSRPSRPAR